MSYTTYDQWRTASRDDNAPSAAETDRIADFYGVEWHEVTDAMLADYEHDLREQAACRDH